MLSSSPPEFSGTERYAVRRTIRSGSSGVVYEAWDRTRNMPVAIKVLRSRSRAAIYRLKQEFRSLEGLTHPNLVTLHELFTEQGHWCLVMEMVEGRDLLSWIRDAPEDASWDWNTLGTGDYQTGTVSLPPESPAAAAPPDMSRVLHAFVQLVLGVHALHGAGKLHRDIKPSNALVRPDGRLVLIDFGLVWDSEREASEQSRIEEVMGTAAFMPPEQAGGTAPTPAADVYAMGVVLFQALTGRLPFEGRILEVLSRKQSERAPRCRSLVPSTPEALDTLVSRMLDSVPDQRPSTREILVALGEDIPRTATSTAFVPRQRARQDLEELWAHARGGQMAVALVSGPQGIGRSTWIRHVLRDLRKYDQALVLRGACHERETVAFKALDGMVDSLRRRLERIPEDDREKLFPPEFAALQRAFPALLALGEADTEPLAPQALGAESERAYSALAELLTRLSQQRPMVVFLDDVHWGDLDSAMLLASLFRQATEAHILWLLSYREEDVSTSPFLVHLLHEPSVQTLVHRRLCLQPLAQSDGARLAESTHRTRGR